MDQQNKIESRDDDSSDLIESFERELKGTDFEKEFLSLNDTTKSSGNDNADDKSQSVVLPDEDNDKVLSKKYKRISIDIPLEVHTKLSIVKSITRESFSSIINHALELVLAEYEKNNSDVKAIFSHLHF